MVEVRRWGDEQTRLEGLEHLTRMPNHRVQNQPFSAGYPNPAPEPVRRRDLKDIEVSEQKWYDDAMKYKVGWRALYHDSLEYCRESGGMCLSGSQRHCV